MNCNSNCFGGNCWWIIILLLLFCCCGNNGGCANAANNNCGCFYKLNINIKIIFRHNKSITQSCIEKSNNYIRNI